MRSTTCTVLLICILLCGCNSKDLTRSKATALISKQFPRAVTHNEDMGQLGPYSNKSELDEFLNNGGKVYKLWQEDGLISFEWKGRMVQI